MMVHDLRSPLTGVLGALDLLESSVAALPHGARTVHLARANAQRQLRLINAILDVSRLEQGTVPLERRPVAIPELVAEVLRLAVPLGADKEVELRSEATPGVRETCIDRDLIARVLENLVANAIRFSPAGGSVVVRVGRDGETGVRVAVHDSGPGVSPELLPRLFRKFAPGGHRGHGHGLGLAFCRLAVEAHGGRIGLEPGGPAGGTTFVLTLPAG
jgi:signal transduction histidine kinase